MKQMLIVLACALAAATSLAAQTPAQTAPDKKPLSKELTSLQGTWVVTQANGQNIPDGDSTLVISGDQYTGTSSGGAPEHGTIVLDPSKTPIAITFSIKDGDDGGKTQYGALQIGDGTITLKLGMPGSPDKPTDFNVAEGFITLVAVKRKTVRTASLAGHGICCGVG